MDNKVLVLAEFLNIKPELIENDYNNYFTVNQRVIKIGDSPQEQLEAIKDFKELLLQKEVADGYMVKTIINGKKLINRITNVINGKTKKEETIKKVYDDVETYLSGVDQSTPEYKRLQHRYFHVVNLPYHLLLNDYDYGEGWIDNLKRAWLGKTPNDNRQDSTVNDGEYLVLTDSEADAEEREYLDNLLDDVVDIRSEIEDYFDREKWIDDHVGNRGENLSSYDGIESSHNHDGVEYFIYRTN